MSTAWAGNLEAMRRVRDTSQNATARVAAGRVIEDAYAAESGARFGLGGIDERNTQGVTIVVCGHIDGRIDGARGDRPVIEHRPDPSREPESDDR